MSELTFRINQFQQKIRQLEVRYARELDSVQLLAVSKRHSTETIRQAANAGLEHFGENYLQEALDKMNVLTDLSLQWHFIGPIQSNKTRGIAEHFDWVHSIDRKKVAQRLDQQRPQGLPPLNVCVQINLSEESSKSGVHLPEAAVLCQYLQALPNLRLRGLMAIPEPLSRLCDQRESFNQLARLFQQLQQTHTDMDTLSMGMSNDFEAAIAEGSTLIRIGTALFGLREPASTSVQNHR
ncbi:MAG: YggS family pyridoxal phosphate-dependent enzyme [Gammaproteobacteria bacterium]|nr:YggS family pyridoxal phosphate-dependent enzyme [Gammaproteobacteria bacterium]